MAGSLSFARGCLLESGAFGGSSTVTSWEPGLLWLPSSQSMGVSPPMCLAPGILPWGVSGTVAPYSGILWDNTSVSSAGRGEVAVGSESISDALKDPSEEDTPRLDPAGLHIRVRRYCKP